MKVRDLITLGIVATAVSMTVLFLDRRYREAELASIRREIAAVSSSRPVGAETSRRVKEPAEAREFYRMSFAADATDSAWDAAAIRGTNEKLSAALPVGSQLRGLECRKSFCRIETSHIDMDRYKVFLRRAFMDPSTYIWNAPYFSSLSGDDKSRSVPLIAISFVARAGKHLPQLPE